MMRLWTAGGARIFGGAPPAFGVSGWRDALWMGVAKCFIFRGARRESKAQEAAIF